MVTGASKYRRFDRIVICLILGLLCCLLLIGASELTIQRGINKLEATASTVITDYAGHPISSLSAPGAGNRREGTLSDMPPLLLKAFIVTEDKRFYSHNGIDPIGIARALVADLREAKLSEGGSTITQQLARTVFLSNDKSVLRKISEMFIALSLERKFSKNELLAFYLNHLYFGRQQIGVRAAAERYFGIKDLRQLELWQIATLAGIPKGPSIYNPVDDDKRSKERRQVVLKLMHEQGYINGQQMKAAMAVDYTPPEPEGGGSSRFASYVDYVIQEAADITGHSKAELQSGGYTIETGLNAAYQKAAETAFSNRSNFPPDGKQQEAQGAVVILDQATSEIRAMVGGRHSKRGELNRALQNRQPGSVFKPIIVYGPALQSGRYSPQTMLTDKKQSYAGYSPANLSGSYAGEVSMAQAVQRSINAPAVWLLNRIGVDYARQFAAKLGVRLSEEDAHLAIGLGGLHEGVSPLQIAQAYNVFANHGRYNEAHAIRSIKDRKGRIIYASKPANREAMSAQAASQMTDMLTGVVEHGTGRNAKLGRPVAGKTGTTQTGIKGAPAQASRDIWFAGYTGQLTAAVWIGFDRTSKTDYMIGNSSIAARMFAAIMKQIT
ncbi:transglycosylase domain-containing protein [Paenibacillus silvisoli]|uniref:transglycosylase domain-containing protein n=1 Tax=Paenibacillus silvisoli TaxID=3110539 RepID=UPI002803C57A|nr:PBP1A family penicillin-binding protein [Paenibacillus silvisoli]